MDTCFVMIVLFSISGTTGCNITNKLVNCRTDVFLPYSVVFSSRNLGHCICSVFFWDGLVDHNQSELSGLYNVAYPSWAEHLLENNNQLMYVPGNWTWYPWSARGWLKRSLQYFYFFLYVFYGKKVQHSKTTFRIKRLIDYSVMKNASISISTLCIGRKSFWTHTAFLITLFLILFLLIMVLNVIKGVLFF